MAEQGTHNPLVAGSSPAGPTIKSSGQRRFSLLTFSIFRVGMHNCVQVKKIAVDSPPSHYWVAGKFYPILMP